MPAVGSGNGTLKKGKTGSWRRRLRIARRFVQRDIWSFSQTENSPLLQRLAAFLRVVVIAMRGLQQNNLLSRAASLSFYSLLALGPLVAVVVVVSSGFIRTDPEAQIKRTLLFIAPSLQELVQAERAQTSDEEEIATALDLLIRQIVEGTAEIIERVNTGGSTAFGALGSLFLIWIVIHLLTSVETTLNDIWGVRYGRPWTQRIVYYWTFISLGVLLGLGSTALFSAGNIASLLNCTSVGDGISHLLLQLTPLLSFLMLVLLLTLFYRFFPNTVVQFRAALVGSLLTAVLLIGNNYLGILYVHRVLSIQSLYGSVGIIPVLMFGLYFFWMFVLFGGQITYAMQNAHFVNDNQAWQKISPRAYELVALGAFLEIARRFQRCQEAPTAQHLGQRLHVPQSTINSALENLEDLGWIVRVAVEDEQRSRQAIGYRPSCPLASYTLSKFKDGIAHIGYSELARDFIEQDSLLGRYLGALDWHRDHPLCATPLDQLLADEESTVPHS